MVQPGLAEESVVTVQQTEVKEDESVYWNCCVITDTTS